MPPGVVGPDGGFGPVWPCPTGIAATGATTGDVVLGMASGSKAQNNNSRIFIKYHLLFYIYVL
jgi:hypothetical protein